MSDRQKLVEDWLRSKAVMHIHGVRFRRSDGAVLLSVLESKVALTVKAGFTSIRQLKRLAKALEQHIQSPVEVLVLKDESQYELEEALLQMLNRKFDSAVLSLFLSSRAEGLVDAWVDLRADSFVRENEVRQHLDQLLTAVDYKLGTLHWLASNVRMPSLPQILRIVKANQPVTRNDLLHKLWQNGFDAVTESWLRSKLDLLRKKGHVLWGEKGGYVLHSRALAALPSGRGSNSSDIERALALGKREWSN